MLSLEDKWEIRDVILSYADTIDRWDWDGLAALFTDDFIGDYAGTLIEGGRQIADMMRDSYRGMGPAIHHLTNILIRSNGEDATARSYINGVSMAADGSVAFETDGWFDDELVRVGQGWRIRRRKLTMIRWQGQAPARPMETAPAP